MDTGAFVSLQTLFEYLGATPSSRCVVEGQAVLNAKHIIACGITEKRMPEIKIFALSLQTSALTERPHEIKGTISIKKGIVSIKEFLCSCKAGNSGRCKHIAAVLLLCSRDNVLKLPELSSTDLKCYWTSRTAEEHYTAAPLLEQECIRKKVSPSGKVLSEAESTHILRVFANNLPDSAYGLHRRRRRQFIQEGEHLNTITECELSKVIENSAHCNLLDSLELPSFAYPCCENFYNSLKNVHVTEVAKMTIHDKELWHKERQFRITGSRCYSVYTYGLDAWEFKAIQYFWPKSFRSVYTTHGVDHEGSARKAYIERTNSKILETGLIVSQKQPWLAYSPDGIIFEDGKPSKLLEIKCPYSGNNGPAVSFIESCKFLQLYNDTLMLKKKHVYYAQIQLGMVMLNLPECDFILYSPFDNNYIQLNIKYDEEYSQLLLQKLHFNYFQKMLHFRCTTNLENYPNN